MTPKKEQNNTKPKCIKCGREYRPSYEPEIDTSPWCSICCELQDKYPNKENDT